MPRLNRLWEDFQVPKGRTWVCGLCGESGRVLLDKGDSYYHAFCICPRGRALMKIETNPRSDLDVLREANRRNGESACGMQPSQYTKFMNRDTHPPHR